MVHLVKNPPGMWKTWVRSLVWEDPLEKGKVTHSIILVWRIPWTIQSMGSQRVRQDWATELNWVLPVHHNCLFRVQYAGKEALVRTRHGTIDWFQIGKGVRQGWILSPWLFNLYAEISLCEMPGWMKHKLESRLPGEISITSDMQMTPPLWQKAKKN